MTGSSMNWPMPAKSTMSSKRARSSFCFRPRMAPFRNTFSRPDSSGWKPAPSSSRADILPVTCDGPLVGAEDLGQALEHRGLARTVLADQRRGRAFLDLEADVLERPENVDLGPPTPHQGCL